MVGQSQNVSIELLEGHSNPIKQWVEDWTVEIDIVASPFDSFDSHILAKDSMVAIIPDHHPLAAEQEVNLEQSYRQVND